MSSGKSRVENKQQSIDYSGVEKMSNAKEVIKMAADNAVEYVDFRFTDVPGLQHHYSMPISELSEAVFEEGTGFDGSSIRGFQTIDSSDMLLIPDPTTAFLDPFMERTTLVLTCTVRDPITGEDYHKDPRIVAKKAIEHLKSTGLADTAYFGPELEFFILDGVTYTNQAHTSGFEIFSQEGLWTSGELHSEVDELPSSGHKTPPKMGYFPLSPLDSFQDLRSEMVSQLENVGIDIEIHHHEVGTAGQAEIDMRFDDMLRMADKVQTYKYVTKNVAAERGYSVTFMPKPLFGDNGSGMHTHQSLWKEGEPLFYDADDSQYANLSEMALHYIGGLLAHAPSVLAFSAPTTNSYKRLLPGYEAPINLAYSQRNRSAAIRIPMYSPSPKAKRLEFRCPDPTANPYLAFSAMLLAGLDGIKNKIEPAAPLDQNIYDMDPKDAADIPNVPSSLKESLDALEADNAYLLESGVFSQELLDSYIEGKREEVDKVETRTTPMEFELYYSI